jgi:hypothetical protein
MTAIPQSAIDAQARYENRGILDKFLLCFSETKKTFNIGFLDVNPPGFTKGEVYDEFIRPWHQLGIAQAMSEYSKSRTASVGDWKTMKPNPCRKMMINIMYTGYCSKDKAYTFILWFAVNEDYRPCAECIAGYKEVQDVSGDPV